MRRRTFLTSAGALTVAGLAGCSATETDSGNGGADDSANGNGGTTGSVDEEAVLTVGTYSSFVDAPSDSPGEWIKDEFEARHDVELEWEIPEQEINHYVERHNQGAGIDAEVYLGVRPQNLVRADENVDGDLFVSTDQSELENAENIGEEFQFDPHDRAIPVFQSYCGIVYDGRTLSEPETFEDLLGEEYEGNLALSNPNGSTTGLLFYLWTINEFGEEGAIDYWNDLRENDARILNSWGDVYTQFEEEEAEAVVSYTNDRVYANRFDNDLEKHQVATLNGQGYTNMAGMARFAAGTNDDLAHQFMDFILEPEVQAVIAERNVTGPVNTETEVPEVYEEYAVDPEDPVFFGYEELEGNLSTWLTEWERNVTGGN